MHISLVGSGNTASITLLQLLAADRDIDISLVGRNEDKLTISLLDAASAYPEAAKRVKLGNKDDFHASDVIAICAGAQIGPGDTPKSFFPRNAEIVKTILEDGVAETAKIVVIGIPVDDLTAFLSLSGRFDSSRVIGFGGDLDKTRLHYVLGDNPASQTAIAIGEHGSRTIPVYEGEKAYEETAIKVRTLLKSIIAKTGAPRNLATGVWLSRLILALGDDKPASHVVCGYMADYNLCLTWPRQVSASGLGTALPVSLGNKAKVELAKLIEQKHAESKEIEVLSRKLFQP